MAAHLGGARRLPHQPGLAAAPLLQPGDVPLPVGGGAARRPHAALQRRRHLRPLAATARRRRLRADGVRRLRHPQRELRAQDRRAPRGGDEARGQQLPRRPAEDDRGDVRLGPPGEHRRPQLLPLDAVAVPALLRSGAGGMARRRGAVVPVVPHRARQRAGGARPLRALRLRRRDALAAPVVVEDHQVRAGDARRPGHAGLVGVDQADAAQLDRAARGRAHHLRPRGLRASRRRRLHHPARHAVRRDLRGHRRRPPAARGVRAHRAARRGERVAQPAPRPAGGARLLGRDRPRIDRRSIP